MSADRPSEIDRLKQTINQLKEENTRLQHYVAVGKSLGVERNLEQLQSTTF